MASERRKPGRASDLEKCPEVGRFIVEAVSLGSTIAAAADRAGVHESTIFRWLQKAELKGCKPEYSKFSEDLKGAIQGRYLGALRSIQTAGQRQWQANAWLLERTMPTHFGQAALRQELAGIHEAIKAINGSLAAQGSNHRVQSEFGHINLAGGIPPDLNEAIAQGDEE